MKRIVWLLALTAACSSTTDVPNAQPTVDGIVTQLQSTSRVLIEADIAKCERFWFAIDSDTRILETTPTGGTRAATINDVTVGRRARAWADGPIAESCPAQSSAGVILLLPTPSQ